MKVAECVHLGIKEYTSLPDVVSENIDTADTHILWVYSVFVIQTKLLMVIFFH